MRKTKQYNQEDNKNAINFNQEKIEITEENLEAYKTFVFLTNCVSGMTPLASKKEEICLPLFMITGVLLSLGIPIIILPKLITITAFALPTTIISICIGIYATCRITDKIIRKMNRKTFQRQYPNFNN